MNEFYVYILYREDGITPMYVGKGKGGRWLDHERPCYTRRDTPLYAAIREMHSRGVRVPKMKIAECLSDASAGELEILTISKIGRMIDGGPLFNVDFGGSQWSPSDGQSAAREEAKRSSQDPEKFREGRIELTCPECSKVFTKTAKRQTFCTPDHKKRFYIVMSTRGQLIMPLLLARSMGRHTKGDQLGAFCRKNADALIARWNVADREAGRRPDVLARGKLDMLWSSVDAG